MVSWAAACGGDSGPTDPDVEPVNETAVLVAHLEGLGYDNQGGFVIGASDVRTALVTGASQYIIDLRSAADFAKGHVQGAVNVALTDLPAHLGGMSPAASSYGTIVLICYSGQSAAFSTGVVRALGYTNVKSMKWGMSAWHTDFSASWVNNRSNARATEFITGTSPAMNTAGDLPTLNTGKTTGAEIAEARATTVLAEGWSAASITHATLYNGLSSYYVINFWPAATYQSVGHIAGSVDYDPATTPFKSTTYLKTLPTGKPVVIYCYTGQTSAYLTGYLRVLGYDARSLLFGANGMIFDKMITDGVASAFVPETQIMDYDYVK
jgi:rhodanese-related sulfurtransferase